MAHLLAWALGQHWLGLHSWQGELAHAFLREGHVLPRYLGDAHKELPSENWAFPSLGWAGTFWSPWPPSPGSG